MNVVLGVGGGIAAYKSAELARALIERGLRVQVVLTAAAQQFITPVTFAALTGRKVITGLFGAASSEETLSSAIEHIAVAQDNDVLVIAPATADLLARLAHGHADDFLTTTYLAFTGPVILAPAMNNNMWAHPATRENLAILKKRGHFIVEPEEGLLACGTRSHRRRRAWRAKPRSPARKQGDRSRRRNGPHHRRTDAGTPRSRTLHQQPLQRQNGLCVSGSGSRTRRKSDSDFRPRAVTRTIGRHAGSRPHRHRNAKRGDGSSCGSNHHSEIRGRRGLSPVARTATQSEEDSHQNVARTRPDARYSC